MHIESLPQIMPYFHLEWSFQNCPEMERCGSRGRTEWKRLGPAREGEGRAEWLWGLHRLLREVRGVSREPRPPPPHSVLA